MAEDSMALIELMQKADGGDFLRSLAEAVLQLRKRSIRPFLRRLSFLSWFIPQEDCHGSISSRGLFREGGVLV